MVRSILLRQLGLDQQRLRYKQKALLTVLERSISTKLNKYPDNLNTIVYDVIEENKNIIMKVLFYDANKACYKKAVAINDCIAVLGMECIYTMTISKKEVEQLYDPSNIHTHLNLMKKLQIKLQLYEEMIEEFVAFDTQVKQDGIRRILNHEELHEGVFNIKLKHMSLDLIMFADSRYNYANVKVRNDEKEKELVL